MYRKSRGLSPWVVDHGRVTRPTVDRQWRGQEGIGVRQRSRWSRAFGHSGARELAGGVRKGRREHDGPVLGLTGARAATWWPGDGDDAAAEEKLDNDSAQASREGEKRSGRCDGKRWGWPPFIGVVRR
jgi:hypothetical protein